MRKDAAPTCEKRVHLFVKLRHRRIVKMKINADVFVRVFIIVNRV